MFEKIVTFIIIIDIAQKSIENALENYLLQYTLDIVNHDIVKIHDIVTFSEETFIK